MTDNKNVPTPPQPQSQAQAPQPWGYNNMYNMYQTSYMYPPYNSPEYYQYYARMQAAAYMNQQQYRGFTPGPVMPFVPQSDPPQPKEEVKDVEMKELPPLPPGPAPPENLYVPNQTPVVRFVMNAPRPRLNLAPNAFAQNQQPLSRKAKKKWRKLQMLQIPPLPSTPPPKPPSPPPPPVEEPQPQPQPIRQLEDWPASLREYVNKCYAKCVTQMDKDRVGVILKGKLMRATNDGTLWVKDWAAEPLPLLDSDSKAVSNLKEKFKTSLLGRLGPKQKTPSPKRRTKRTYRSNSSSSRSSTDSYRSRSSSPKSPKKNRKKTQNKKKFSPKSHFYSEFGMNGDIAVKKEVLDKRAARFNQNQNQNQNNFMKRKMQPLFVYDTGIPSPLNNEFDISDLHIVGTCEDLEKSYLRLTSAPEASQVRPPSVLFKALDMVKKKWSADRDYHYVCEQLKSIRQDLTVQGIRDNLSVEVYETHARIALEKRDHAEFNQCQSQLRILHSEVKDANSNQKEFLAYRILYYIFTKDFMDLNTLISSLKQEDKADDCIKHAVQVSKAWLIGSYHRIFKLYKTAPRMSSYIMDLFIQRERTLALKIIIKAYRPSIPVDFIRSELAFETDSETEDFLSNYIVGLVFTDDTRTKIDCKTSSVSLNPGA